MHCIPAAQEDPRQKWYLKANHVEAARWIQSIERSIQYLARDRAWSPAEDLARRKSAESDRPTLSFFEESSEARGVRRARSARFRFHVEGRFEREEYIRWWRSEYAKLDFDARGEMVHETDNISSTGDSITTNVKEPPHELGFALHDSVAAQLELTAQLVAQMGLEAKSVASLPSSSASSASFSDLQFTFTSTRVHHNGF